MSDTARFESDGHVVMVTYRGRGAWSADARDTDNAGVVAVMRAGLALVDPIAHDARRLAFSGARASGWIRNHTAPTSLWMVDATSATGSHAATGTLDACMWTALEDLDLAPLDTTERRAQPLDARFHADACTSDALVAELAHLVGARLSEREGSDEFERALALMTKELDWRDHQLACMDDDGAGFTAWSGRAIAMQVRRRPYVPVEVAIDVRLRR